MIGSVSIPYMHHPKRGPAHSRWSSHDGYQMHRHDGSRTIWAEGDDTFAMRAAAAHSVNSVIVELQHTKARLLRQGASANVQPLASDITGLQQALDEVAAMLAHIAELER